MAINDHLNGLKSRVIVIEQNLLEIMLFYRYSLPTNGHRFRKKIHIWLEECQT